MLTSTRLFHPNLLPIQCLSTRPNSIPNPTQQPIADSGILFREKLRYLSTHLQIDTQKALTLNPNLRSTPLSTLHTTVQTLSSMGMTRPEISRVLNMHPVLLTSHPDLYLYPLLDFLLNEAQIPFPDIPKSISRCPRLLISSVPKQLRPNLKFLKSLGFVGPNSINSQTTLLLVYNKDSTLMVKVNYLLGLGLEFGEVKTMLVRSPGILTFSMERNLKPKVEYLLREMGGDLKDLKVFPQYFSFSLEGKIKPRHRMLVESGVRLPLPEMLKISDGEFCARLIELRLQRGSRWVRRMTKS